MKRATFAWQFRAAESLHAMLEILGDRWGGAWIECDSDYKQDSIAGKLTDCAAARIYKYGIDFYIVNLTVKTDGDLMAAAADGQRRLLDDVLPLVSAREVKAAVPTDGT